MDLADSSFSSTVDPYFMIVRSILRPLLSLSTKNSLLFSDQVVADSLFELADGSATSDLPPTFGKSRVRRLDGPPEACRAADDMTARNREAIRFLGMPSLLEQESAAMENQEQNGACFVIKWGFLPWGVCSTGDRSDIPTGEWDGYDVWILHYVVLSKLIPTNRVRH